MKLRTQTRTGCRRTMRKMAWIKHKPHVRIFSFGGGIQSTAVLVLQAQGKLKKPFDVFVFANVGDDSENPATLEYMREYSIPFAGRHGIPFVEVQKTTYGKPETLYQYIYRTPRSVPIPARMSNGAPSNRSCTSDFKIQVIDGWIKEQGHSHATVGLGISLDEFTRMKSEEWHDSYQKAVDEDDTDMPVQIWLMPPEQTSPEPQPTLKKVRKIGFMKRLYHPLIHARITRQQCHQIIEEAGLPMPPRSACWFCPFTRPGEWIEMSKNHPLLFQKAIALEQHINAKRHAMEWDQVYLHAYTQPLVVAVAQQPRLISDDEMCDGYCHI